MSKTVEITVSKADFANMHGADRLIMAEEGTKNCYVIYVDETTWTDKSGGDYAEQQTLQSAT